MKKFLMIALLAISSVCAMSNTVYYADSKCIRNLTLSIPNANCNSCNIEIYIYDSNRVRFVDKTSKEKSYFTIISFCGIQTGRDNYGDFYRSEVYKIRDNDDSIYYLIITKFDNGHITIAKRDNNNRWEISYIIGYLETFYY